MKRTILLIITVAISILISSQALSEIGSWEYGPTEAVAIKDSTAYISSGSYLWVLDISDESNISLVDEIKLDNYINYIRRIGNYLYVSKNDTILEIYDIQTADNPSLVNQVEGVDADYNWYDMYTENDTIYLSGKGTLQYYLNDTINPQYIRKLPSGTQFHKQDSIGISIVWGYNNFRIFNLNVSGDITLPDDNYSLDESPKGLFVTYPYAYFGYGSRGIGTMDISNIYSIDLHSTINTNGYTYDIELIEDTIMIATRGLNGIGVYDVENDTIFTLIGECDTDGYTYELEVIGDRLYVGARSGGLIIIDITDKSNPTVLGEYQGYGECRRMDIEGNRLYSASGDGGLMIMDITNRTNPTVIGQCYTKDIAEDVVKEGSYVYIADGDSGLTVINIIDENNPSVVGGVVTGYYQHLIDVYGDMAALSNSSTDPTGVPIIDISTPTAPVKASEVMVNCDRIEIMFDSIYLHSNGGGGTQPRYRIIDLSDMYNPVNKDSIFQNFEGYGALYAEGDVSYMSYMDTFFCYDVSDPNNITVINTRDWDGVSEIIRMKNDTIINYIEGGYRIYLWDYTDPYNPDSITNFQLPYWAYDIELNGDYMYNGHGEYGLTIYGFNMAGIEDNNNQINTDISIISTLNSIQIQNNTNTTQTYQIADITGRVIDNISVKQGLNTYTPKQSGIYFVINNNNKTIEKAVIIK